MNKIGILFLSILVTQVCLSEEHIVKKIVQYGNAQQAGELPVTGGVKKIIETQGAQQITDRHQRGSNGQ